MKTIKLVIKTDSQKYPIIIGSNILSYLSKIFNTNSISFNKCLLNIFDKFGSILDPIKIGYFSLLVLTINLSIFINIDYFINYLIF